MRGKSGEVYELKARKNALEYFDKGFEHYNEYERILREDDYAYTAPYEKQKKPTCFLEKINFFVETIYFQFDKKRTKRNLRSFLAS